MGTAANTSQGSLPDPAILKQGLAEGPLRWLLSHPGASSWQGGLGAGAELGPGFGDIAKEDLIGFADGLGGECKMKRLCLAKEEQMLDEV